MRRALILALCLGVLTACSGSGASRDAEALRMRVERLEREAAEERARQAEELAALRGELASLRESLDEATRHLAALSGQEAGAENAAQQQKPKKSARAALKESLSGALESSKQAMHRLGRQLDKALTRKSGKAETTSAPDATGEPGTTVQPAKPE